MPEADTPPTQVQNILKDFLHGIPQRLVSDMIVDKLAEQGVAISIANANSFAKNMVVRDEHNEPVAFRKAMVQTLIELKLALSEDDFSNTLVVRARLFSESLQNELQHLSAKAARNMLRDDEDKWPEVSRILRNDQITFRKNLYRKWKGPIEKFRMLRTICLELGTEFSRDLGERPPKGKDSLFAVLISSHIRACQIADEILCLIEGGFADGAMARSRSLHEISVISAFVFLRGEDVARRYFAHKIVDLKKDADRYWNHMQHSADDRDSKVQYDKICGQYEKAIREFGKDFKSPYGWAADCLGKRNPRFSDIEKDLFGDNARYLYRMASESIHIGSRNLYSRPGLPVGEPLLLEGPSDIGFGDPGRWAATSLVIATVSLCALRDASQIQTGFEFTTALKVLMASLDGVSKAFDMRDRGPD